MERTAGRLGLPSGTFAAGRAVARRPALWRAALRQARVLVPTGWWRRRPFLPLPDRDWMAFRLTTAYGDPAAPIVADDLVTWLEWSATARPRARTRRLRRSRRS